VDTYLDDAVQMVLDWDAARPRSKQTEPGWSNMADCRAEIGYRVAGEWPTDEHPDQTWRPAAGTALHTWYTHLRRRYCHEQGIPAAFGVPMVYRGIPGTADEVLWPAEPGGRWEVTDFKFPRLASIRLWNDDQFLHELFTQPHGYAAGLLAPDAQQYATDTLTARGAPSEYWSAYDLDPDACVVRLLGGPVDGKFTDWQSHQRPFSQETADAAADRYDDVHAAVANGEDLPRDKPIWWCERFCVFVSLCRGFDRDVDKGPLEEVTDPELAAAIEQYGMAGEMARAAEKVQKELRPLIEDARGTARGWRIYHARGNPAKMRVNEVAAEQLLGERGIPLAEIMEMGPPGQPKLTVTRAKKPAA
jgi:hypothetical protein